MVLMFRAARARQSWDMLTGVNTTQHTAEQCVLCQPIPLCSSPK